ncbi:oligosaccharide flippase family protein [Tenacibaculum geojense]|uniref:Oligosaccharide flippase family protein n=1 Tax=Tenacibaculum geojense TaxID=915352 RepID=A0ABW3JU10_9FLAO
MKLIANFIQSFLKRAGSYIFAATIISRVLSFLSSWIAIQLIENKELGEVLFAWTIITFILPMVGLGLPQSLIRYGALNDDKNYKQQLLQFVIKKGTLASCILVIGLSVVGFVYPFSIKNTTTYLPLLAFSILPYFFLETIKIQYRLQHNNKKYAYVEIINHLLHVFLITALSSFYNAFGYALALLLTPTITVLFFISNSNILKNNTTANLKNTKELWRYGFFGGLSNLTSTLLFSIDILLIGSIMSKPEMVTNYKYISLIPFSMLFLPRVFITTDFVSFTEKITSKSYIFKYIKSYILLFLLTSIVFLSISLIFQHQLLSLLDSNLTTYSQSFIILCLGVCGILIFRGLYGNLLSAIGQVKINYYIAVIALIVNYFGNQYLIPKYGIMGAAITSAVLMWGTGIATLICFHFNYYKFLSLKKS